MSPMAKPLIVADGMAEPTISNVPLPVKAIPPLTTAPASSTTKPPPIRSPLAVPPDETTWEPAKMVRRSRSRPTVPSRYRLRFAPHHPWRRR
jgi:hypothetical protein